MSRHLLLYSVGPVFDFIQAARRTRDIHIASWIVTELARKTALAVRRDFQAELISPVLEHDSDPATDRVLAIIPSNIEPAEVVKSIEKIALDFWTFLAGPDAFADYDKCIGLDKTIWDAQHGTDLFELFAAWVPLERDEDYASARESVENLLLARETLTEFQPNPLLDLHVWTSSLDGRRETVLKAQGISKTQEKHRVRSRIKNTEQLDLPGVVKRLHSDDPIKERYAPVSRIAVDAWVRGASGHRNSERWKRIQEIRRAIQRDEESTWYFSPIRHEIRRFADYEYGGELLFPKRVEIMRNEIQEQDGAEGFFAIKETLRQIAEAHEKYRPDEPFPYLAVLSCDGDGMSRVLRDKTIDKNREISKSMAEFAKSAELEVERNNGSLVYAGGDDVLAFVPLDKALICAENLYKSFTERIDGATLSVGIAIVHAQTPMRGQMIALAQDALTEAKKIEGKNSLAVSLYKRSGAPVQVVTRWNPPSDAHGSAPNRTCPTAAGSRFSLWVDWLEHDMLPDRLAFELHALSTQYREHGSDTLPWVQENPRVLKAEITRILKKKKIDAGRSSHTTENGAAPADPVDTILSMINTREDLDRVAKELIIARTLLRAREDAVPPEARTVNTEVNA